MNINISDTNRFVWWNVGASATRTTSGLLKLYYDMCIKDSISGDLIEGNYVHENCTPYEDYTIICSVRNPYSWIVKEFDDVVEGGDIDDDFENFINTFREDSHQPCSQVMDWENSGKFPDYYIKMEDMYSSFMEIPILANKMGDELKEGLTLSEGAPVVWRKWKPYYNEKLANRLYNYPYIKKLFELTGYDRDSWK